MYGYDIFHEDLMSSLINTVHDGNCSHAYIFEGDRQLGIFSAARLFAAALACANPEIAPCGACPSCIEAKAGTNPDIIYPKPDKDAKSISVKNMRGIEEDTEIKPFSSLRKVYVFEDGDIINPAAQNVFLKTLEEPPDYAAFIIAVSDAEKLLQTIRSRSVIVHFPSVSDEIVRNYITDKYPEIGNRLDFLVKYCAGVPLRADSIIADESFEPLRAACLEKLGILVSGNALGAFEIQKFAEDNKDDFPRILDFWMSYIRDIILIQTGAGGSILNMDKSAELRALSARTDPEKAAALIDSLVTAQKMTARYVSVKAAALWLALPS